MNGRYRYSVLAVCCAIFGFYHAARLVLPPALPVMQDQLGLNYAQAGFLGSAYDLGFSLTLIVGGYLADRVNKGRLILAGLALLSTSLMLTTLGNSLASIAAIRILTGASFGTYFASGVSMISSYFPSKERGKALGIHTGVGAGLGKLLTPLLAGLLLPSLGWRPLYFFVGIPVLLTALVFWRVVREPCAEATKPVAAGTALKTILRSPLINALGLCSALIGASSVTLYSFLPLYLVNEVGADVAMGGFAVAIVSGASMPSIAAYGALSDRFGRRSVIFASCILSAAALYIFPLIANGSLVVLGIVVLGIFAGTPFPVILSLVVDVTPRSYRGLAVGYFNTFSTASAGVAAISAGYISDVLGVRMVFAFIAGLAVLAALLILLVAEPKIAEVAEKG